MNAAPSRFLDAAESHRGKADRQAPSNSPHASTVQSTMESQSMRILHLANHADEVGNGIVNAMVDIASGQAALGHGVAVASAGGRYIELLQSLGVRHYFLDQARRPLTMLRAPLAFRRIIREFDPDIVHCHMMTGMVIARALGGRSRPRLISHIHNVHQRSAVLMGLAERVIAVSAAVADDMAKRGVPKRKMRVVVNGTKGSPRLPALSSCVPAPLEKPAIVTVAGMYERKGIAQLIAAFERLTGFSPAPHLYLVGDGPDRSRFEEQARLSPASERIHFSGFQKNPKPYLLSADIFVLASLRDSCPLVIPEAREAGRPIIASDVDGIPEQLDYGRAGLLVPPDDIDALHRALQSLLGDTSLRKAWSEKASSGHDRFSVQAAASGVIDVYRELLEQA